MLNFYTHVIYVRVLALLIIVLPICAISDDYVSGKDLCAEVSKVQKGEWTNVPIDYENLLSAKSPIYHRFLSGKYDASKETVVYISGGPGATSHNYHKMYDDLAKSFNILFIDQRGYVCSRPDRRELQDSSKFYSIENSARDIDEIRKKLEIKKWSILGHSFGATISLEYARLFPNSINNITLIGPAFITPQVQELEDEAELNLKQRVKAFTGNIKDCNALKLINDLSYDFANSFGIDGLERFVLEVNKSLENDSLISEEEAWSFLEKIGEEVDVNGEFSLRDDSFTWETQGDTELIVESDLACSFLGAEQSPECINGEKKTFDVKKMNISVPVNIFLGEFDGVPAELDQLKGSLSKGSFYYMKDRGHGSFLDFYHRRDDEDIKASVEVLTRSLSSDTVSDDLKKKLGIIQIK